MRNEAAWVLWYGGGCLMALGALTSAYVWWLMARLRWYVPTAGPRALVEAARRTTMCEWWVHVTLVFWLTGAVAVLAGLVVAQ